MMQYYSLLFLGLFFSGVNPILVESSRTKLYIAFVTIYIFIFSFSYQAGVDWLNYKNIYYLNFDVDKVELGYNLLCEFFRELGVDYWGFIVLVKTIVYISIAVFIYKLIGSRFSLYALISYLSYAAFFLNDTIRQQIAFMFFLFSVSMYINKKIIKSILFIFLGGLFHYSIFICFILFIIPKNKKTLASLIVLSCFLFLFVLLGKPFLSNFLLTAIPDVGILSKIKIYFSTEKQPIYIGLIFKLMMLAPYYLMYISIKKNRVNDTLFLCAVVTVLIELAFFESRTVSLRFRLYFELFFILYPFYVAKEKALDITCITTYITCILMYIYATYALVAFTFNDSFFYYFSNYQHYILELLSHERLVEDMKVRELRDYWSDWSPR